MLWCYLYRGVHLLFLWDLPELRRPEPAMLSHWHCLHVGPEFLFLWDLPELRRPEPAVLSRWRYPWQCGGVLGG
jgi:hypothetical protein